MAPKKRQATAAASQAQSEPAAAPAPAPAEPLQPISSSSTVPASLHRLVAPFPLTWPIPSPLADPSLIPPSDVELEQTLLLNAENVRQWKGYIQHVVDANAETLGEKATSAWADVPRADLALALAPSTSSSSSSSSNPQPSLGLLSTAPARLALRRLTLAYERALAAHPYNYRLRLDYLAWRARFVLGRVRGVAHAESVRRDVRRAARGEERARRAGVGARLLDGSGSGAGEEGEGEAERKGEEYGENYWDLTTALDGVLGVEEWHSLAAAFERSLAVMPKVSFSSPFPWEDRIHVSSEPRR